ncbi:conserved hypothetical protein [Histoplasma capsulatum var. duboisii H88]|uniref:Uncharacterized protein n=1 Tax=Ajellomyces capsulatus (strain H88) TaxID=544711 RepID=F0UTH0_AJEC8|nr:conserved hypothetical protein [Histoplasma capsulatum var. duboisii H88]
MSPTKRLKNLGLAKEYAWVNVTSRNALGLLTRTTSWFPGAKYRIRSASGNFFIHAKAIEFGQEATLDVFSPLGRLTNALLSKHSAGQQTVVNRQTAVDRPLRVVTNYDITVGYIYRVKEVAADLVSAFSLVLKNNIGAMGTKAK